MLFFFFPPVRESHRKFLTRKVFYNTVCILLSVQEAAEEEELDKSHWGELESESESEEESEEEDDEEPDDTGLVTPAEGLVNCLSVCLSVDAWMGAYIWCRQMNMVGYKEAIF